LSLMGAGGAIGHLAVLEKARGIFAAERHGGLEQRGIDTLTLAGAAAGDQGCEDAVARGDAGEMVRQRNAHRPRSVEVGQQAEKAAHRLADRVIAGARRVRTGRTEPGYRAPNEARIVALRIVVAEPEPLHGPGTEVLDQDVGGADEQAR